MIISSLGFTYKRKSREGMEKQHRGEGWPIVLIFVESAS
jgi:hypothetical protein